MGAACVCETGGLTAAIREDLDRYVFLARKDGATGFLVPLRAWFLSQGLWASTAYRLTHYARYRRHSRLLSGLPFVAHLIAIAFTGINIDARAHIAPGLRIPHGGYIVIGPVQIGRNCDIFQGVTLGVRASTVDEGKPRTPLNNADRAGRSGGPRPVPGAVGSSAALIPPCLARRRGLGACRFPVPGVTGVLAGQASAQVPFWRVSPCRSRVRRLIAAHRVCSQASFLAAPR